MLSISALKTRSRCTSDSLLTDRNMKLFCRRYGEGPPLIILHGLYGSSDNWVTIAKKISKSYTVYLPDLRNHGASPHSEVHDYDSMSDDLLEMASEKGLNRFFLAGHSMGGKTAVRFTMKWPEMIMGLLVADISPFETKSETSGPYREHTAILNALRDVNITGAVSRTEIEKMLEGSIKSIRVRDFLLKNIRRNDDGSFDWKINHIALFNNLDKITGSAISSSGVIAPITGFPVIFLKGEESEYLPEEHFGRILSLFPAAEFRIIRNAGHWLHADNPDAVSEAFFSLAGE